MLSSLRCLLATLICLATSQVCAQAGSVTVPAPVASAGGERPRIALVLSGGGARGGAHIGVLRVLEELRVPVDIIVGTSAGSIVGAAYASGLRPDELEQEMQQLNTATLFRDASRADEPLRRKAEDGSNYIGPEFGLRGTTLSLPKGAISGVALEAVLRRLTRRQQSTHFDELPIRFRAVATDLATGDMVVLDHGSLASAIRASMAVPGAVNPIEIDSRLLVDGGLTRNLPVDVARHLGADVVIAVNIGTPLLRREELTSFLSVSEQMLNILTEANVRRSLEELGPRDVLIQPELDGMSAAAFDRLPHAVRAGVEAARAQAEHLRALAVPGPAYAAYAAVLHPPQRAREPLIDEVNVLGTSRVDPAVVRDAMRLQPGSTFDTRAIDADIRRIYGRGDFESVNYDLAETESGHALNVHVAEKSWGPNYVRFGLSLSSDFSGNSFFNLLATHRMTWLNRLGAEWHSSLQIGRVDRLSTEWYQPLDPRQRWFVAPGLRLEREPFDVYDEGGQRLFGFRRATREASLDLGMRLGQPGEFRVGVVRGAARVDRAAESALPPDLVLPRHDTGGVRLRLAWDELDSLRFPRSGFAGTLNVMLARPGLGATDAYNRWEGDLTAAMSRGPHALSMGLSGGGRYGRRDLPIYEQFPLGGFLNLSGYRTGQLYGDRYVLGRAVYTYRLAGPAIFDGAYVGASYELGRIGESFLGDQRQRTRSSMALFLAVDGPLGPVYLGYGRADARNHALYFFLGVP